MDPRRQPRPARPAHPLHTSSLPNSLNDDVDADAYANGYTTDIRALHIQSTGNELYVHIPEQRIRIPNAALDQSDPLHQHLARAGTTALPVPGAQLMRWLDHMQLPEGREVEHSIARTLQAAIELRDRKTVKRLTTELAMRLLSSDSSEENSPVHEVIHGLPHEAQWAVFEAARCPLPLLFSLLPRRLHESALLYASGGGTDLRVSNCYALPEPVVNALPERLQPLRYHLLGLQALRLETALNIVPSLLPSLSDLTNLTCLQIRHSYMRHSHISIIGPHLHSLTRLQVMDFTQNKLCNDGAHVLAQHLTKVRSLTALLVGDNSIGTPGASALVRSLRVLPNFRVLDLSSNSICLTSSRLEPLDVLNRLHSLSLDYNGGEGVSRQRDAGGYAHCPFNYASFVGLTALATDLPQDVGQFALQLTTLKRLRRLHLVDQSGTLNEVVGEVVPAIISLASQLESLKLDTAAGNQNDLESLHMALSQFSLLSELELQQHCSPLEDTTGNLPEPAVAGLTPPRRLRRLRLQHLSWGNAALSQFLQRLGNLTELEELTLTSCALGAEGGAALGQQLYLLTALTELCLEANGLSHTGMRELGPSIMALRRLRVLKLGNNRLGSRGTASLSEVLVRLTALEHLDLSKNRVKENALRVLAPQLRRLTCLTHLDLTSNEIEMDMCMLLGSHLRVLPFLREVHIQQRSKRSAQEDSPRISKLQQMLANTQMVNVC